MIETVTQATVNKSFCLAVSGKPVLSDFSAGVKLTAHRYQNRKTLFYFVISNTGCHFIEFLRGNGVVLNYQIYVQKAQIETVGDLIEILSAFPPKTKVFGEKFVQQWSGNPEDTDLSDYQLCQIHNVTKSAAGVILEVDV